MQERLEALRGEIDALDAQLARLFERRLAVCEEIGAAKQRAGLPVLDEARERAVLARYLANVEAARRPYAERFARSVIGLCREAQLQRGKGDA